LFSRVGECSSIMRTLYLFNTVDILSSNTKVRPKYTKSKTVFVVLVDFV